MQSQISHLTNNPLFALSNMFLLGESHGRRSLVACSPWGRTESDTTEAT